MSRIVRAAGFAAAALSLVATATFAGPSLAWVGEPEAAPAGYTEHAAANGEAGTSALNTTDAQLIRAQAVDFDAPVIEHAVATVPFGVIDPKEVEPAEEAEEAEVRPLSELVDEFASADVADDEQECLAIAIYYESKGEPLEGQLTVAEVIKNRAESGRFPSSYCGVVKQRGQFSFVRGGRLPDANRDSRHWRTAVAIAHIADQELADGSAPRALFFHARRVSPGWKLTRVATVGNHVFYR